MLFLHQLLFQLHVLIFPPDLFFVLSQRVYLFLFSVNPLAFLLYLFSVLKDYLFRFVFQTAFYFAALSCPQVHVFLSEVDAAQLFGVLGGFQLVGHVLVASR